MRTLIKMLPVIVLMLLGTVSLQAQKKKVVHHHHHHNHGPGKKVVVVKRSPYRPRKVAVFHPVWGPKYNHYRRWVFFPRYNLYWDHWRGHWMFWNGAMWISQAAKPAVIVNVNLENEKNYELKENEDDEDDVYKGNDDHKKTYKPE